MSYAEKLYEIYGGLHRAHGKNNLINSKDEKGKQKSKNQTVHENYTENLWDIHLKGVEGLGVIPITDAGTCNWGAIDVEIYPLDLIELETKTKSHNLPVVILRTKSGGAHITVYFKDQQSCRDVRNKMAELSFVLGLGEREIYPKQVRLANNTDVGNWLNMPYFNVFNGKTERHAVINGKEASLDEFLAYVETIRLNDIDELHIPLLSTELDDGPPCLQRIIQIKAGPGERNNVLFNMGVYVRLKHESDWEKHLEECNHKYLSPPLSHREVGNIVKSLEKKNYTFTCNNPPVSNYCNREVCKNREFGIAAFEHIDVGIIVDSITKMTSEPPIWVLSLEGVRSEVETDELLDQSKFRRVCVNAINKIPGRMKNDDWDKFIRTKLSEIEIINAPKEAKTSENVVSLLPQYLNSVPEGFNGRDMLLGKWVKNGTGYLIRGKNYLDYLERMGVKVDPRKLWIYLLQVGVTTDGTESWHIPMTLWDPLKKEKPSKPKETPTKNENF